MNQKFWIQYPWYGHQMLRPSGEPEFWKEYNGGAKDKIFIFSLNKQKVKAQKACQILVGQIHKLFT
jgi:hypothetical protein